MEKRRKGRGPWVWLAVVVLAALVAWLIAAEALWRNPEATSDSRSAVVQPAAVPEPRPAAPAQPSPVEGNGTGDAARGESAVRGDGAAVNNSPTDARP
nr:hypothetical protein [uncultured Brevundimonas sp.]